MNFLFGVFLTRLGEKKLQFAAKNLTFGLFALKFAVRVQPFFVAVLYDHGLLSG